MIQKLKEQAWFKPAALLLAILATIIAWQWLAGALFLARFGQDYGRATPMTVYNYWHYYGHEKIIRQWAILAMLASGAAMFVLAKVSYKPKKTPLHGNARLAELSDMKKVGLLEDDGVLIGKFKNRYLRAGGNSNRHVMLKAPTGEGKGVAVVTPTALTWKESMVAFDLKGELLALTSGYRAKFQSAFVFNPLSPTYQTHRFNPLGYLPEDQNLRISEIQKISTFFFPDRPNEAPVWTATPRSLFMGIALMLCETPGKLVTIGQVRRESLVEGDGVEYFNRVIKERQDAGNPLSPECVRSLNVYTSIKADVTRAGILAGFRAALELWANPLIDAATSANDFDLRKIRTTPMSIYLVLSQDSLFMLAPLITLFYQQLFDLNTRKELKKDKSLNYHCLMIQDERAALGKISALDKGIAYLRSYGFVILSVFQSMGQVAELLSREGAKGYTANHGVQVIYPPSRDEVEDAEHISKAIGTITVKVKSKDGKSFTEVPRRLKIPEEVCDLGQNKAVILRRNMPAAIVEKIEYYSDPNFTSRLLAPIEIPTLDIEAHSKLVAESTLPPRQAVVMTEPGVVVRPITAEDIPNLKNLALKDFVLDFSKAAPPASNTIDFEALDAYAERRCKEAGLIVEEAHA